MPRNHEKNFGETIRLSDTRLEKERDVLQNTQLRHRSISLIIYCRDGVQALSLVEGRSLVIGRLPPSDYTIRDSSLSRQHACLEVIDGEIWVEDLQSTNGTRVNGRRIERAVVRDREEIVFGTVPASVHFLEASEARRLGLDTHDSFQTALDAEVQRARTFGRYLALLMISSDKDEPNRLSLWFPRIREHLRPFDHVALYSSQIVELFLPEYNAEQAANLARSIIEDGPEKLFCGVGIFPDHAGSAQELIEVTRKAHAAANRSGPFRLARAASPIEEIVSNREESAGPVIASQAMKDVYSTAARLAPSVIPVLLLGETGTGKEVVASAIHRGGRRKKKPMICVNCGSIPEQLVESTLFGHEKGAYTGANQQQKGVFESAHGGTIFLDEIGELPLAAQAALLRVLEVSRFCRVGSPREIEVDVRVLAATHQDLESMCNKGSFREDLLYRLNAMTLKIPPLRERPDEIRPLAARFIKEANIANQCQVTHVDEDAMELLEQYSWPGNVRELKNAVTRAVVISENNRITIYDLPEAVRELHTQRREQKQEVPSGRISLPPNGDINLKAEISQYEADLILQALHRTNWDRNQAARSLGLPLRTLAYKMQTYGIRRTSYGPGKTNDHNK